MLFIKHYFVYKFTYYCMSEEYEQCILVVGGAESHFKQTRKIILR